MIENHFWVRGFDMAYKNKADKKVNARAWYLKNKKRILLLRKKYQKEHKETIKTTKRKHYLKHKQEILARNKKYQLLHTEEHNKSNRKYKKTHRHEINKYQQHVRDTNIGLRIRGSLALRIWGTVKKGYKSATTMKLVGCSIEFLKIHLQNKFKPGMTWTNYGAWHIDHIRPCASFDLSKPTEQRKCFNFTNLQPLWAKENLSKGKRYV